MVSRSADRSRRRAPASAGARQAWSEALPREQLVELLVALADADVHAARHHAVPCLERVDQGRGRQARAPIAQVLELETLEGHAVGHALPREGLDDDLAG